MSNLDERNPHFKRDPRNYVAPYTYSEYPKYVTLPDGTGVTVENELEEAAARGELDESGAERQPEGPGQDGQDGRAAAAAEAAAGTTSQGTVIRKTRQPGQPGRPSNAERAARAAAEAAAGDQAS
ncbi:hypothetical protein DX980_20190 [Burkholderia gladioli]|uniref:hypothetical protein n=1 Tax=Burkholderia gladioli TaxID=28095 RepID=UPI001364E2A9|nr:hypothetical protein [Burkholderia gladioli]KAF1065276.1 hypothetical protein LvStA_03951 [Burkholderia gladioli]WAG21365.1 hypothetical protein DX980_20190 [Burkholderia gladioli]